MPAQLIQTVAQIVVDEVLRFLVYRGQRPRGVVHLHATVQRLWLCCRSVSSLYSGPCWFLVSSVGLAGAALMIQVIQLLDEVWLDR